MFSVDMVDAVKVQFLKPIFEDDFPERGMKAWLTRIEKCEKTECFKLYFDFKDFEDENDKYFTEEYYPNIHTKEKVKNGEIPEKQLYTAKEAGMYKPKYNSYFGSIDNSDYQNMEELKEYLRII